ncbi:MAG: AarF/ABC1/UbiB kinase family protein [Myxococcales bacterium]|nr:AarF/ABC1/UbiB kinase family protein [Myxococcales bacterium]
MTSQSNLRHATARIAKAIDQSIQMVGHIRGHIDTLATDVQRDSLAIASESRVLADSVSHKFALTRMGVQASPRALRISAQLLAIALRYRLEEGRQQACGLGADARMKALHQSCAQSVRQLCEQQRGAFLKLGQFLSMRPDLLPAAYIRELSALRDRVPALPYEDIRAQLEAEFEGPTDSYFADIETEAVAAASLAQVHHATGLGGEKYALKVQIPEAEMQVSADIAILRAIVAALPTGSLPFDIRTTLDQIANSVHAELDYAREAEHCENLRILLRSTSGVRIPRIMGAYSSARVLTMEWMPGVPLDQALEDATTDERRLILTRLVQCFAQQIFGFGYFHADPHSGNILVHRDQAAPDGFNLVLLDFGCVERLSDEVRLAYASMLRGVFCGDQAEVRLALDNLGFAQEGNDPAALEEMVVAMIAPLQKEGALMEWARDPKAATRALIEMSVSIPGLKTPRHFVLLGRVLATLGGIIIDNADSGVSLPTLMAVALANAQPSSQR